MPSGAKKGHHTEGLSPRHPDFDRIDLICAVASAVCRYQQFRAATKIVDRIRRGETREGRSGVVWHTQGSGKSLTMVFVARMMRTSPDLQDFKIVLVNDRVDLEEQLSKTAKLIGGRVNVIESIDHVWDHLSTEASDINMVMVHKFQDRRTNLPETFAQALGIKEPLPSASTFGVVNPSPRILLMIDEAHRTQKGNESGTGLADNLFEAFPNAARIAFTGTPLITERHALATQRSRIHLACDTNLSPGQCQLDHARRRKAVCGAIQAASGHRSNHSLPIRTFINDDRQQPRTRQFHIVGSQHSRALQLSRRMQLAPVKHLVRVDPMRSRHSSNRHPSPPRLFHDEPLLLRRPELTGPSSNNRISRFRAPSLTRRQDMHSKRMTAG